MPKLSEYHGFEDSVRWRVVAAGVEIDGTGLERTKGTPSTVTRVWESYGDAINRTARARRVPCELIVATICTESGGNADAQREEPGYKSDAETPQKVSAGLMQTLISTASDTLQMSVDRRWLLVPANSIEAGTAYIAKQARETELDPPLVAAAYNAGALKHQDGSANRWKLRQYRIGTGEHCDRFVRFLNDAAFVLARHPNRPSVTLGDVIGGTMAAPRTSPPAAAQAARNGGPAVTFASNAKAADVTPYSLGVVKDILIAAKISSALVSSTARSPADQARVMFNNAEKFGLASQKKLYGPSGDKVLDVYAQRKAAGATPDDIKAAMETKIKELGPTHVSRHASDPRVLNVFDIAPSSIKDKVGFEHAVKADSRVSYFLVPPTDPGYHLEIPQPR
jgi:Transglycosylase SLT domain